MWIVLWVSQFFVLKASLSKCFLSFRSWLPFVRAYVCRSLQVSNDSTSLKSKIWSLDLNKIRKVVHFEHSRCWDAFAFCHMRWDSGFPVPRSTKKQTNKQNRRKYLLNFDLVFMVWLPTGLRPYNRSNTQLSCYHLKKMMINRSLLKPVIKVF